MNYLPYEDNQMTFTIMNDGVKFTYPSHNGAIETTMIDWFTYGTMVRMMRESQYIFLMDTKPGENPILTFGFKSPIWIGECEFWTNRNEFFSEKTDDQLVTVYESCDWLGMTYIVKHDMTMDINGKFKETRRERLAKVIPMRDADDWIDNFHDRVVAMGVSI